MSFYRKARPSIRNLLPTADVTQARSRGKAAGIDQHKGGNKNHKRDGEQNRKSRPEDIELKSRTDVGIRCRTKIRIKSVTGIGLRSGVGIRIESGTGTETRIRIGIYLDRDGVRNGRPDRDWSQKRDYNRD
ncbi:hypothetical protein EVAR_79313_1 [Eumeta japonica]|uniref:Uncharacterized protein n=1 Tax=Eumeta variegata TaxID=151549 RepID=A0A4C1TFJ0_EUMVA|nr:hypothetical protein EVAR_79313_1 [Eumeta japonica]